VPQVAAGWPVSVHRAAIHSMMGDDDDAGVCYLDASYQPAACTLVQIQPGRILTEKIDKKTNTRSNLIVSYVTVSLRVTDRPNGETSPWGADRLAEHALGG